MTIRRGYVARYQMVSERFPRRLSTAFLNGDIDVEIYVEYDGDIYRLLKSLYGLKQSPRLWYEKLTSTLRAYGFEKLASTRCVYRNVTRGGQVIIIVYVDDLIILASNTCIMTSTKRRLATKFKIQDLRFERLCAHEVFFASVQGIRCCLRNRRTANVFWKGSEWLPRLRRPRQWRLHSM